MKIQQLVIPIFLGLAVCLLALGLFLPASGLAAPGAAPTPVTGFYSPDGNYFSVLEARAVTTDTRYIVESSLASFEQADIQYLVDQGTVNTTTVTIQFSNDKVNWVSGPALVSSNAADGGDLTPFRVFGRYTAFYVDVTNTNPVTWTINLLAK